MKIKNKNLIFISLIIFLAFFSISFNQYHGYVGILPIDSFLIFNSGYDLLNGYYPFKDYWTIKEPFIDLVQGLVGDRLPKVLEVFAEVHASHPKEPHWYLQAVGTVPQMQGRGIAARILKPILEIWDAEGVGAYLESTNPRNLSFYYRLGFNVKTELLMDGGKAALTCMWREPT